MILASGEIRKDFNTECTPGYYNNEGKPNLFTARNGGYFSPVGFMEILRSWREANDFEGLEVTMLDGGKERSRL